MSHTVSMRVVLFLLPAVLLVSATFTACAGEDDADDGTNVAADDGPADAQVPEPPPEEPAPDPDPPPAAGPVAEGVASVTDRDGYTFDVPYRYAPLSIETDIASEKPGFSSVIVHLDASIEVQNTTAGRELTFESVDGIVSPLGDPAISIVGLWDSGSPLCTYTGVANDDQSPCGIVLAYARIPNSVSFDESVSPTVYAGTHGSRAGLAGVPDSHLDAVLEAVAHPDEVILTYSGNDTARFEGTCPNADLAEYLDDHWVDNYVVYNSFNSGHMPMFAPSSSCGSNRFQPQPPVTE